MKYKKNEVKCDISSYIHYWRGVKKSGKTTLFYQLVKSQFKDLNKGLLISIGDEIGYQALDGLVYAEAPTWAELIEVFDDLVENKADNEFEVLGLDTVDEWVKLAKEEVRRLHKKAKGVSAEFNACFGGYGAPRDMVVSLIDEQLARLRRAGYGLFLIGHTKIRDIKEKNGDEYQQLTSNLNGDYDGIFANKADIVMTIMVEKNIDKDKHIDGTTRYMYFRSDGFVDAGGRFPDIPEKVEYGADNYVKAFEIGVKGSIESPMSDEEMKKRIAKERVERAESAEKYSEKEKELKENAELEEFRDMYTNTIKTNFKKASEEIQGKAKEMLIDAGFSKFTDPEIPMKTLKAIADLFG